MNGSQFREGEADRYYSFDKECELVGKRTWERRLVLALIDWFKRMSGRVIECSGSEFGEERRREIYQTRQDERKTGSPFEGSTCRSVAPPPGR